MPENACLHIRTPNKRPYFHWLLIFYQGNFSPCFSIAFPIFFCVKQIGKLLGIQRLSSDTKKPQKGINFAQFNPEKSEFRQHGQHVHIVFVSEFVCTQVVAFLNWIKWVFTMETTPGIVSFRQDIRRRRSCFPFFIFYLYSFQLGFSLEKIRI